MNRPIEIPNKCCTVCSTRTDKAHPQVLVGVVAMIKATIVRAIAALVLESASNSSSTVLKPAPWQELLKSEQDTATRVMGRRAQQWLNIDMKRAEEGPCGSIAFESMLATGGSLAVARNGCQ
jgi:hypothetical protein